MTLDQQEAVFARVTEDPSYAEAFEEQNKPERPPEEEPNVKVFDFRVYGERPLDDAFLRRIDRDRVPINTLKPAVAKVSHYGVKCWAYKDFYGGWNIYYYRRDGRIQRMRCDYRNLFTEAGQPL